MRVWVRVRPLNTISLTYLIDKCLRIENIYYNIQCCYLRNNIFEKIKILYFYIVRYHFFMVFFMNDNIHIYLKHITMNIYYIDKLKLFIRMRRRYTHIHILWIYFKSWSFADNGLKYSGPKVIPINDDYCITFYTTTFLVVLGGRYLLTRNMNIVGMEITCKFREYSNTC